MTRANTGDALHRKAAGEPRVEAAEQEERLAQPQLAHPSGDERRGRLLGIIAVAAVDDDRLVLGDSLQSFEDVDARARPDLEGTRYPHAALLVFGRGTGIDEGGSLLRQQGAGVFGTDVGSIV